MPRAGSESATCTKQLELGGCQTWAPQKPTDLSRQLVRIQPETHFDLIVRVSTRGMLTTMIHVETLRPQYVLGFYTTCVHFTCYATSG